MTRRISITKVRRIIEQRVKACDEAVERYVVAEDAATEADARAYHRQMAATERCARAELRHVLTLINQAASPRLATQPPGAE